MNNKKIEKVLITGITGSGGSYLSEYIILNHPEVKVHGIARWHSTSNKKNLENISGRVKIHDCDLTDLSSVLSVINDVSPDAIFHLAAHANVKASWKYPQSIMINNIQGTINLFEAIRISQINPIVQICSSSEVYGQIDKKNIPITEDCPIQPCNPYAVSKTAQDFLGLTYFKGYGIPVIRTRMFSYLNPRREDLFATSFAMQVAKIEKGLEKELLHGNLESTRSIIDVRDAMESYWFATTKGRPGEVYNIGGKKIITVGEFLRLLKKKATCEIKSRVDKTLLRPTDVTLQIPNTSKFENETGWTPKYSFEQSIQYLLDYCRRKVNNEY